MASASRLPLKSILFTTTILLSASASRINLRSFLLTTFTGPGSYSRIAAAIVILANLKNVPFAWHFRVFNSILKHCLFSKPNIPPSIAPSTLFLPLITSTYNPLSECDYNFHKSNSTYFSDLDISRSHIICCLFQPGIHALHHNKEYKLVLDGNGEPMKGGFSIMLGGVMCGFKREIGIYEGYEMWSRLLCWDRKWVYVVTHFVKKGAVRPKKYILTDGKWFGRGKGYKSVEGEGKERERHLDEKAIFATSISKYVVKMGRLTVHPEVLIGASGMLPARPGGWATMSGGSSESESSGESTPLEGSEVVVEGETTGEWDWRRIEEERQKGLKYAEHFAALDGLHHEFSGSKEAAVGRYRDFLW